MSATTATHQVVGVDLSLGATGIATPAGTHLHRTRPDPTHGGLERRIWTIVDHLDDLRHEYRPALFVIEGPVLRSQAALGLAMLHGAIRTHLWAEDETWAILAPATLKKFATGKGNADKGAVLAAAIRRLGYPGSDHNEADALWLRQAGLHHLGHPDAVALPKTQLDALVKGDWPDPR